MYVRRISQKQWLLSILSVSSESADSKTAILFSTTLNANMNLHFSRLKNVMTSLAPPAFVLFAHLFRHKYWPELYVLDVVAHYLGGFAIAWMGTILVNGLRERGDVPEETPNWLLQYAVLGSVFIAGVLWEFMEWGADTFLGTMTQFSIPETMGDLFMDVFGGVTFLLMTFLIYGFRRAAKLHRAKLT